MQGKRIVSSAAKKPMLSFVFSEFQVKNRVRNLSPATIKGYQDSFNRLSSFIGHDAACDSINVKVVENFIAKLMDDGIKPSSINHYLRNTRSLLYWCMEEDYVQRFKIRLLKEQETVKGTYSDEQIRQLIREPPKLASFVEWRCWSMVCWFLATGNRAETVCSIKMKDLVFSANEININKTKTNLAMILPMSTELRLVLRKYISLFRMDASDDDFLFCSIGDVKLSTNALKISMNHYNRCRDVNMTGIHAFRHTFAKNWIRNTGDVFRLQKVLGHKSLEMTRRYVNMFSDDLKKDFDRYCPLERIVSVGNAKNLVRR